MKTSQLLTVGNNFWISQLHIKIRIHRYLPLRGKTPGQGTTVNYPGLEQKLDFRVVYFSFSQCNQLKCQDGSEVSVFYKPISNSSMQIGRCKESHQHKENLQQCFSPLCPPPLQGSHFMLRAVILIFICVILNTWAVWSPSTSSASC